MQLKITKQMLLDAGACSDGIDQFVFAFGEESSVEWTRDKQIEMMKSPIGKHIGWAWRNNLLPLWNLSRANLSMANLSRANLSGANLSRAVPSSLYAELFASFGWEVVDGRLRKKETP